MKTLSRAVLLFICYIAFSSFVGDTWKTTTSKGGRFTLMMPQEAKESIKKIPSGADTLIMNLFMYDASAAQEDNLVYLAIYTDYPESYKSKSADEVNTILNNSVDGAMNKVNGTLVSKTDIKKDGYPGKEYYIDFQNGAAEIHARAYLVKNRMYILETIYVTASKGNKSDERFMNSFVLNK